MNSNNTTPRRTGPPDANGSFHRRRRQRQNSQRVLATAALLGLSNLHVTTASTTNFCGTNWDDASSDCVARQPCPTGTDEECKTGTCVSVYHNWRVMWFLVDMIVYKQTQPSSLFLSCYRNESGLIQRVIQLKVTALCLILTIHSISDSAAQDGMMQTKTVALNVIVHLGIR